MVRALIAWLVVGSCGVLQAAPLVYFTLEGRRQGSMDAFASSVEVALGETIEYRLQMQMAPLGTQNSNLRSWNQNERPREHGVNSLSLSILQDTLEPVQVNFGSPAQLVGDTGPTVRDGWHRGTGARGGLPSPRLGSDLNDLLGIRPFHVPGMFTGSSEETVLVGAFTVADVTSEYGQVRPQWGPSSGALFFDGSLYFITSPEPSNEFTAYWPGSEAGPDPIAHFTSLTLTAGNLAPVPEPSTISLLVGAALFGLLSLRRKRRQ